MHDYAGCIHFHSNLSYDARVPVEAIVASAQKAGLHFAVLTDHFNLDARAAGWERYHGTLLFIVGEEISPRYNHYVALGTQKSIVMSTLDMHAQVMIDAVQAQGGFGFISHPDHGGAALDGARAYPWIAWDVKGFAGLGIWDLQSDWNSQLTTWWNVVLACLSPGCALRGPQPETLARWDALAQKQHCVGIGEIDNHGPLRRFLFFSRWVFTFDFAFHTIRTHVLLPQPLTGDAKADQVTVLNALRTGHSYVSLDLWNDPTGFRFEVFDDEKRVGPGGTITPHGPALLEVALPSPARFRLLRNGHVIWEEHSRAFLERDADLPGVYRVEVDQYVHGRWRPWIFSNPIWVENQSSQTSNPTR